MLMLMVLCQLLFCKREFAVTVTKETKESTGLGPGPNYVDSVSCSFSSETLPFWTMSNNTKEYQVIARRYRPQRFSDVLGQESIVQTLKNAIKNHRIAHAYLFSGSRGTGKTTLARIFAKALNCPHPDANGEPCNQCPSCLEITAGSSLDVLEIDGASHRGIEDIRQINETAGYAPARGQYKIYIIDEVHMLTKEAFNALLKTLEEPPPKVKFFFATTEPHKVLPTIVSRCQRFNLNRIPIGTIAAKLKFVAKDLGFHAEEEALLMIANMAEGGLRDAESLLDQVVAFHEGDITTQTVASILGVVSRDIYFSLDLAAKQGELTKAFEITERIFAEGKNLTHFVEGLVEHFRNILLVALGGKDAPYLNLSVLEREQYLTTAGNYTKEQCLSLLDYLLKAQQEIRHSASARILLEAILLHIIRSHQRVPLATIVQKLHQLETRLQGNESSTPLSVSPPAIAPQKQETLPPQQPIKQSIPPSSGSSPVEEKKNGTPPPVKTPLITDKKEKSRYDTILQFAAVELEGTLEQP